MGSKDSILIKTKKNKFKNHLISSILRNNKALWTLFLEIHSLNGTRSIKETCPGEKQKTLIKYG
jgi:hypothetical protein